MNVVVTTKFDYNVTLEEWTGSAPSCWEKSIWHWRIPLKLKIFVWLSLNNKVLTWDNIQRSVSNGSGICILSKGNLKMFFFYFFNIWSELGSLLLTKEN